MTILNKEKILEGARILVEEGKFERAVREYEKIAAADPADLRVKLRIAELYTKMKQINDAIRMYREVASHYAAEGFFLKAVTVYKNVIRLNPSLTEINEQLAKLYEKMDITADAVRQYDIVASALEGRGEVSRVLEIRQKIVDLNPDDPRARRKLAELYQFHNRMDEALDQYEAIVKILEKQAGTEAKRVELYERILTHRGDRVAMLRELVRIYLQQGEQKRAIKWLETAKEITPYDEALLSQQADIYVSLHQLDSARNKYLELATLHKENGHAEAALYAYGTVLLHLPDEAERIVPLIEELGPDAMEKVQRWLDEKRGELAVAAERRAEEEAAHAETIERQKEEAEKAKKLQVELERKQKIRRLRGEAVEPASETKPPQAAPLQTAPAVKNSPVKTIAPGTESEEAEASFTLGRAYLKMGLEGEGRAALQKAKQLYGKLQQTGSGYQPKILARLAEVAVLLGEEVKEEKPPEKKGSPPPSRPSPPKKAEAKKTVPPEPPKGGRKISFV